MRITKECTLSGHWFDGVLPFGDHNLFAGVVRPLTHELLLDTGECIPPNLQEFGSFEREAVWPTPLDARGIVRGRVDVVGKRNA